jgi:hypothetical protein
MGNDGVLWMMLGRAGIDFIVDSSIEAVGYLAQVAGTLTVDLDHHRIPDDRETGQGLDPEDASNANLGLDWDRYPNIEEHRFSLTHEVTGLPEPQSL